MKKLFVILTLLASCSAFAGETASDNAATLPTQGMQVGGKGADNRFHYLLLANDGSLSVTAGAASLAGAANLATGQVTAGSAGTLVIARATRRHVTVKNTDAAITVYIGPATVTSANGMPLKAGESINVPWVGLIQVLAASGSPVVAYADYYD